MWGTLSFIIFLCQLLLVSSFNGDNFELECPDECDCHYFRINWVTDCSENNLTQVPYNELSLSVYILDLNGNNITKLEKFPKEIKMRRIQIANNMLQSIGRDAFAGMEYLIDVDISGNNISYIDPEAFIDSRGLLNLEMQNNPLKYIDGAFLISNNLQFLDISFCGITVINPNFFDNLTSLTTLDLSGNPLQVLESGTFDSLSVLDTLKLNDCKLSSIAEDAFENNSNLKTLELAGNYLTNTDWSEVLGKLTSLQMLNLKKSRINSLTEDSFSNNSYLETLILAENELNDLDVATTLGHSLQYLETLDFSNCHIKGPLSGEAFANATKLKTLFLSGNPLFAPDLQEALQPLPRLEKLFLRNCGLRSLPDTFNTYTNLQELDISYNPLVDAFVRVLAPLEKLEYLNMGYSNLSYLGPTTFSQMTSMKRLVLSGNDLNSLEAGLFANLTQLTSLELEQCGLKRPLNANVFFKNLTYTDLKELKLGGNPLIIPNSGPILTKQLSQLTTLDLSNCNISFLNPNAFLLTPNITDLNLAGNKISYSRFDLAFIASLNDLETLNLSSNNLTTINPQIFDNNPKLKSLNLVGNRFICNCSIAEMWDWANMVKGDLDMLVGSKIAAQDISIRGNKKKKSLLCHYDEAQLRNMTNVNRSIAGRRPIIKPRELSASNRTWAKYVRESGCEPLVKILRPSPLVMEQIKDSKNWSIDSPINIVFFCLAVVLAVGIAWSSIRLRRRVVLLNNKQS